MHKEHLILIVEKGKLFKTSRGKKEEKLKINITSRLNTKNKKRMVDLNILVNALKLIGQLL